MSWKNNLLLLICLIPLVANSQAKLNLLDDNDIAVIGATVWVQELRQKGKSALYISDKDGAVQIELKKPLLLSVSHLGFSTLLDTLRQGESVSLRLSPSINTLDEVVVTGQFQPQSAKNSVYKVRTIGSELLENQSPASLGDLLAFEPNIQFNRDNATGRSGIELQGMSGQYVKVLIDGLPVAGRSGASNEFDLSQVDVRTIQRVEIIEGPMSVNYGADALAGVINIITQKDVASSWEINASAQSETVGKEYGFFDKGIHSPSITAGINLNQNWSAQVNGRMYQFGGWKGTGDNRNKQWYPKTQYFGGVLTSFRKGNVEAYYRFDHMAETIQNLGSINDINPLIDPFANDIEYQSQRMFHQLQSDIKMNWATLNSAFSYTDYRRETYQFETNLVTSETSNESVANTAFYNSYFTRQTLNQLFQETWGSLQAGIDGTHEIVSGSTLSDGNRTLTDIAYFATAEILLGKLKIRSGVRFTSNSLYKTIPTPSVNFNHQPNASTQIRWSYGRGFRAPSLRELYHEFIDSNHNIIGNPNLKPEYSHSINVDVTKQFQKIGIETSLGGYFNDKDNLIAFITNVDDPGQATSYVNQLKFKTAGLNTKTKYTHETFSFEVGASYIGRYQLLSENDDIPSFLFFPEIISRWSYSFAQPKINLAAFYKFNGSQEEYRRNSEDKIYLAKRQGFHMLDLSASKSFENNITLRAGVRNVLDITTVNSTTVGGAHSSGDGNSPIAFGRSYFLTINYHFKN